MSTGRRPRHTGLAVLAMALVGVLGAVLVTPAATAAPPLAGYRVSLTPTTVQADTVARVVVTIHPEAERGRGQPLKEAVVTLPGLQVQSVGIVSGPPRFAAVAVDAATVRLDAAGPPLLDGESVAVEIVLIPAATGTYPLVTQASAPAGKALHRIGADPVLTVGSRASAVTALEITGQPTSTVTGAPVTPAVQVTARDAEGRPVAGVPVTLAYGTNPGDAAPPSGNTATAGADGVATFPDLTVPAPGIGYTLVATAGSVGSPQSDTFDVGASVTPCGPNTGCDSEAVVAPDGNSRIRIRADAAASSDALTVYFDDTHLSCQTQQAFTATFNVDNRTKTVTYTALGPAPGQGITGGYPQPTVCFGSPTTFPTGGGGQATFNPANDEFEGLLPDCASYATPESVTGPCVAERTRVHSESGATGTTFTVFAPVGDPRMTR
jgi:hypothetical protein